MQRRKFLIGLGALTAGSTAAVGTGALSSATVNRSGAVNIDTDTESNIAFIPGDDPDIETDESGCVCFNLWGADGEGVNVNSTYWWGDPANPAEDYAFKIVNNDEESLAMKMNYYFANTGWIENHGNGQCYIRFMIFDVGDGPTGKSAENYPHQSYNKDYSLGGPTGDFDPVESYRFNPGEEYYVVIKVDSCGGNASKDADLSGTAHFEFTSDAGVSQDSWDPANPPA